jgi:hypothetical protein
LARWADRRIAVFVPQGVALGWANGRAFGPQNGVKARDKNSVNIVAHFSLKPPTF